MVFQLYAEVIKLSNNKIIFKGIDRKTIYKKTKYCERRYFRLDTISLGYNFACTKIGILCITDSLRY